jgi:hypothetical protein
MVALVATIHVFAPERPCERRFAGRRLPLAPQDVDARDKPEHDGVGNLDPVFSRMGEGGAERRMRACACRRRPQQLHCIQMIRGGPSPLPLSHPGEGFPALCPGKGGAPKPPGNGPRPQVPTLTRPLAYLLTAAPYG